jgi:hypothetical protein
MTNDERMGNVKKNSLTAETAENAEAKSNHRLTRDFHEEENQSQKNLFNHRGH